MSVEFFPNYTTHPGNYLKEIIETRKLGKDVIASKCQITIEELSKIINELAPISPELANRLEEVLGVSNKIWNRLQALYDLHHIHHIKK